MEISPFRVIFLLVLTFANFKVRVQARAFFVFGDSLVDNGNNNYLATTARADSPPYGIDYPNGRPTGRFSNGLNIADIINLRGQKLLVGANFASAGVGVLNDTGVQFVNIIRIHEQLNYFAQYKERLSEQIGKGNADRVVAESLVLITLGGNDFVNNYYLVPFSLRSQQFSIQDYVPFVVSHYKTILQKLYNFGLRRILVTGTGPLGCVPAELALHSTNGECADIIQNAATLFNPQLLSLIEELNKEVGSNVFTGANTNNINFDFVDNPQKYGFKNSKDACCGQGPYNGLGLCTPFSNVCDNREDYVFWDAFHPTEKANRLIVQGFFNGSGVHMHPVNLNTMLALDSRA
ncbi:GDSL esterase/lipase At5g33370-like isoform X2 [Andrographis paniculata]|uniref:GDSL esterase/lipase At5g33370-like isoform X2 n=1 Tax=Andrographis paniculata TaxID=175694 RepID=UPI0021E8E822|nr:GDSL esterase/lipase At5g33370-like isoform X2 [Andrographis paniculata]